jgi:thiol-disulfide isomerase/thioredoxin
MNLKSFRTILLIALVTGQLAAQSAPLPAAQPKSEASIKPGDPAPALKIAEWVKGTPITQFEPGKVYLVEFWATWCGPCIGNIPHLNALQKKYAKDGLVVIGMTNPDVDAGYTGARKENNTLQQVRDFVAAQGEKMSYHVAYDTPMRDTYKSMMGTVGGIPHAFLIGRDGRLAVDYHPFYLDDAIDKVLAGTWNYDRDYPELRRCSKLYGEVLGAKDYEAFKASYSVMERDFPRIAQRTLSTKFSRALKAGDQPAILAAGRAMMEYTRESEDAKELAATARATARDLVYVQRSDVSGLTDAARFNEVKALIAEMAACAVEMSKETDSAAFSAQAELAYGAEDLATAVSLQKKAVASALNPYARDAEQKRCDELEKALANEQRRAEIRRMYAPAAN